MLFFQRSVMARNASLMGIYDPFGAKKAESDGRSVLVARMFVS